MYPPRDRVSPPRRRRFAYVKANPRQPRSAQQAAKISLSVTYVRIRRGVAEVEFNRVEHAKAESLRRRDEQGDY